jgi:hypothetical protein
MSNQATPSNFLACIPHAIEPHWDNVWAPRLAGFPVNVPYFGQRKHNASEHLQVGIAHEIRRLALGHWSQSQWAFARTNFAKLFYLPATRTERLRLNDHEGNDRQ